MNEEQDVMRAIKTAVLEDFAIHMVEGGLQKIVGEGADIGDASFDDLDELVKFIGTAVMMLYVQAEGGPSVSEMGAGDEDA